MTITNSVVANAIKAQTVTNSVEVEISPGYAARVQHAMRDAERVVSGVRMTSTNTLECRDEDAADDVIDILKQAGLPDGEVWTNAKRAARNARLVPFDKAKVEPGDSVWFKGREFEYKGSHGSLLVELEDVFDGEAEFVSPYDRNLKMAANAAYKLSSTEAKVGDRVKVVGALGTYVVTKVDGEWIEIKDADDGTPQGRVEARFATPVRNAIEPRTGVDKEIGDHIYKARQALADAYYFCKKVGEKDVAAVVFKAAETLNRARW